LQYEYIEGGDLAGLILDWHRQAEQPSPAQVAKAMLQLAEIVAFAHRLDPLIVHRDLKPANILVQRSKEEPILFKKSWVFSSNPRALLGARRRKPASTPGTPGSLRHRIEWLGSAPEGRRPQIEWSPR
jgi:serine/threonine protein kinase